MLVIREQGYAGDISDVGEVRIQVKLTNGTDDALARLQQLAPDRVRICAANALVDTGAVRTVLPSAIVQQLGLPIRGQRIAEYADGRKESVSVTGPVIVEIM